MVKHKPSDMLQYKIRVPYELSRQIKKLADKSGRPISTEIVRILEQSFVQQGREAFIEDVVSELLKQQSRAA